MYKQRQKSHLNMSGMEYKILLNFVCVVLICLSSVWLLELHESY